MNDPTTGRLTAICSDLARLADTVAPLAAQLELEYLIGRLERLRDDLRGAELAARVWARQEGGDDDA